MKTHETERTKNTACRTLANTLGVILLLLPAVVLILAEFGVIALFYLMLGPTICFILGGVGLVVSLAYIILRLAVREHKIVFILALLKLQTSTYAAAKCPKCGQIGGVDNYDPMAGAWECPKCKEVVVWVQGRAVSHFGQLRKRLKLGWHCHHVDALIQEREARKADEENRRKKYFGVESA